MKLGTPKIGSTWMIHQNHRSISKLRRVSSTIMTHICVVFFLRSFSIQVALKLLARGANVFAQNEHGATALHYSSVEGSLEVTKAILDSASSEVEKLVTLLTCSVLWG
jgi:ankyrin repeat protein